MPDANDSDDDAGSEEPAIITVPVEIPIDDEVHRPAWETVEAAATSPEAARESIGEALGESIHDLELQSLVYDEYRRVQHEQEQTVGMLDEMVAAQDGIRTPEGASE